MQELHTTLLLLMKSLKDPCVAMLPNDVIGLESFN